MQWAPYLGTVLGIVVVCVVNVAYSLYCIHHIHKGKTAQQYIHLSSHEARALHLASSAKCVCTYTCWLVSNCWFTIGFLPKDQSVLYIRFVVYC